MSEEIFVGSIIGASVIALAWLIYSITSASSADPQREVDKCATRHGVLMDDINHKYVCVRTDSLHYWSGKDGDVQ